MLGPAELKKLLRFGLIGSLGCLIGWLFGEAWLAVGLPDASANAAPSLVSRSANTAPPPEFETRLKATGAQTGDVQISLIWNSPHDLDLHCLPPAPDSEIFYDRRRSGSGGFLDVDTNAGCSKNLREKPVENIYWPKDQAPQGEYRVYVNFFTPCPKDDRLKIETNYEVSILAEGQRQQFQGTIRYDPDNRELNRKLVHTFTVGPKVQLFAPKDKIDFHSGQVCKIPFEIHRVKSTGGVRVSAEGLPAGVTAKTVSLSNDETKGVIELSGDAATANITLVATMGDLRADAPVSLEKKESTGWSWLLILIVGLWTALLAAGLTLALVIGQNLYLGKPWGNGAPLAAVKAAGAGFVSGALGQVLLFLFAYLGLKFLGLLFGWMLLGFLLGRGVSLFIPNLAPMKAAFAGLVGGALGAIAYIVASLLWDPLGRFGGSAVLGLCIGLMVAIVEVAFRKAWLEIKLGPREIISVNLGPEPVKIGSDMKMCTVFARGAAPLALKVWVRDGAVMVQEHGQGEQKAKNGEKRNAGSVEVVIHTGSGSVVYTAEQTPAPAPVPAPAPKPVPPSAPAVVPSPAPAPASKPVPPPVVSAPPAPPKPAPLPVPTPPAAPAVKPVSPIAPPSMKPVAPPAAPAAPAASANAPDACPICKRKATNRYCLVCDRKF